MFNLKHAKKNAQDNVIIKGLYLLALPLVNLFSFCKISPNQVTVASTVFTILAAFALNNSNYINYFYWFWLLSLVLDFADGMLARSTGNIRSNSLRFDHLSDIFKIAIILLGTCIYYDDYLIWALGFSAIFLFQFSEIVFHDMEHLIFLQKFKDKHEGGEIKKNFDPPHKVIADDVLIAERKKIRDKNFVIGYIVRIFPRSINAYNFLLTQFKSILFNFEGHTLLLFLFLPINKTATKFILFYISFLSIRQAIMAVNVLRFAPRING